MKAFTWIAASAVLTLAATVDAAQTGRMAVSHYEPLQKLSIVKKGSSAMQKAGQSGSATLNFDALGKTFELQLEPNRALPAAGARSASDLVAYRGRLNSNPNSWVRIVVHEGAPSGLIWDGEEMYAIESPRDSSLPITAPVVYRLADSYIEPGSVSCGASAEANGAATYQKLVADLGAATAQAPGATQEMGVGMVGDFEFTSAKGGDAGAAAAIVTRMNNVDGIFSEQLGVQLNINVIDTFSGAADPFTGTTVAVDLLDEVADYRLATPTQNTQGLTHLYTGRDLDTSTVGIAYQGVLCATSRGAGLSEGNGGATFDSLIAAHELGHNFGAPHDGEAGSPCESETGAFIMAPSLNGSDQFSSCSILNMQDNIDRAACITALPSVDIAVSLRGGSPTFLLAAENALIYDIDSIGTMQVDNVAAEFTLPTNLSFNSVSASAGSCSFGAGTVSCTLGNVAGSSTQTVTINTTAAAVGVDTISASVTADVDDRLSNNDETLDVTVDPAVDLVVSLPARTTIDIDQSTTVNASLENRAVLDATGVTLTVTLNNGLRADSASWAPGSCSISGQVVSCLASTLAAQSTTTVSITMTGLNDGTRNYTAQAASNEADARLVDNTASSSIRVREDEDSGGGAAGPLLLWMLGLGALLARRTRRSVV